MHELWISPWWLALLFFGVAIAYASVGLGGATAYTALLTIFGAHYHAIPSVSLALSLIVTTVGASIFLARGHGRWRLIAPLLVTSMPAAYLGGAWQLPATVFYAILLVTLLTVAARIFLWGELTWTLRPGSKRRLAVSLVIGAVLGLVAGSVGIGGGILLVPIIVLFGLGTEREAAACGAFFIWCNAVAGLAARVQHYDVDWIAAAPLMGAVLLGGSLGAALGSDQLKPRQMQRVLGVIVLVAIGFLVYRLVG